MKTQEHKWLFVTGATRGTYTTIDPDGDQREIVGLDLNLGIGEGASLHEAAEAVIKRAVAHNILPDKLKPTIIAYEVKDDGEFIKIADIITKAKDLAKNEKEVKSVNQVYEEIKCRWCGESLPKNGAAQFSHLSKHITQLVATKFLDKEQASTIRKIKLSKEMEEIFYKAKTDSVFNKKETQ